MSGCQTLTDLSTYKHTHKSTRTDTPTLINYWTVLFLLLYVSYGKSDKTDEKIKLPSFDALIKEYLPPDDISASNIETDTSKESEGTTP